MGTKLLQCKQKLMELSAEELRTVLLKYYESKGVTVVLKALQKSYKLRVCPGYGRSEGEALLNACRIAFEGIIDASDDEELRLLEQLLEEQPVSSPAPEITRKEPSDLFLYLQDIGFGQLASQLEEEEIGLAELKIIDKEDLRRSLNLPPETYALFWDRIEGLRAKDTSTIALKAVESGEASTLRAEIEKLKMHLHLENPPEYLICPLTQELFRDPVTLADGHTYERKAVEQWLASHDVSPVTSNFLASRTLRDNLNIREAVKDYRTLIARFKQQKVVRSNGEDPRRNLYQTSYGHHLPDPTGQELKELESGANKLLGDFLGYKPSR